ncbi:hypothetical protein BH10ACI1_BH10ACI1_34500 [soil metagenome]
MAINYQKTYETLSYEEGMEFRDLTIKTIQEIYPHYKVTPVEAQNPDVIFITNQEDNVRIKFGLRDLYTIFARTSGTRIELKETILKNYAQVFKQIEDAEQFMDETEPQWADAKDFIQPRLSRISDLNDNLESYINVPFGEGIVTIFNIYLPETEIVKRITKDLLEKWDVSFEEMYKKALDNFAEVTDGMELVGTGTPHGYLWNEVGYEYAATSILLGGIRYLIAQNVGSPYRFGIPSGHRLLCWAEFDDKEFQIEMKAMVERDFDRIPNCLTTNIYEVDDKGQVKQVKDAPEIPQTPTFSNN